MGTLLSVHWRPNKFLHNKILRVMKYIILLLIGILFIGCSSETGDTVLHVRHVDLSHVQDVSAFDLVDSITVVSLETNDSCLVSYMRSIQKKGDKLYILDGRQETLFCFGMDGSFLFKIHRLGNGPEEYQHIESFCLDEQGNIYLVEPWGIIHMYSPHGEFMRRIEVFDKTSVINKIYCIDDELITGCHFHDVTIGHFPLRNDQMSVYRVTNELTAEYVLYYQYGESVYLVSSLTGMVCQLGHDGYAPYLQWDFGKGNNDTADLLEKVRGCSGSILGEVGLGKLFKSAIYSAFENDRFNFMVLEYDNDFIHVVYDKLKQEPLVFRKTKEKTIFAFCNLTDGVLVYNPPVVIGNPERDLTCIRPEMLDVANARRLAQGEQGENNPSITLFWLKNK